MAISEEQKAEARERLILDRICQLLDDDPIPFRTLWNEHFPERELEQFANDRGRSFD